MDSFEGNREAPVHGRRWLTIHNGYFTDPEVAYPFLAKIQKAIEEHAPTVVVDLGGGTGYILSELAKQFPDTAIKYINVESSKEQLQQCTYQEVVAVQKSVTDITRQDIAMAGDCLMFIMRSLVHYLGQEGIRPFMMHVRRQMKQGELLIHQTACFEYAEDAECINRLYKMMGTNKWFPTTAALRHCLAETGWNVTDQVIGPSLSLRSDELAERYSLSRDEIRSISWKMHQSERPVLFNDGHTQFCANLDYTIFTCRAV